MNGLNFEPIHLLVHRKSESFDLLVAREESPRPQKSLGFIVWATQIIVPNFMAIHPIFIDTNRPVATSKAMLLAWLKMAHPIAEKF